MVDVTSILTSILSGGQSNHGGGQLGGLGDILGQLTGAAGGQSGTSGGGLGDILGQLAGAAGGQGGAGGGLGSILGQLTGGQGGAGGGLGDILGQLTGAAGGQGGASGGLGSILGQLAGAAGGQGGAGGGIGDILSQLTGAAGGQGGAGGGGLGDILGQLTGGAAAGGQSGGLGQLGSILSGLGGGGNAGILGTLASSGALAGLAGAVLGGGGKAAAAQAAKIGGMAILANLAMKALANHNAGVKPAPTTLTNILNTPHTAPATPEFDENTTATLMLRAMVSAAYADGELDAGEKQAIVGQLVALGVTADQQAFIDGLLNNPVPMETYIQQVSSPEMKAQIYLASRQAITVDTQEERDYLTALAQGFGFDKNLKAHLDHASDAAKATA